MDSYDSNQILILQHLNDFSRPTRCAYFCTAQTWKYRGKTRDNFVILDDDNFTRSRFRIFRSKRDFDSKNWWIFIGISRTMSCSKMSKFFHFWEKKCQWKFAKNGFGNIQSSDCQPKKGGEKLVRGVNFLIFWRMISAFICTKNWQKSFKIRENSSAGAKS